MTVVAAILLIPAAVLLGRFADTIVVTLVRARSTWSPCRCSRSTCWCCSARSSTSRVPLRAINRTAPLMYGNMVSIVVNAILLAILLPTVGLLGAAIAFVIARMIEGALPGPADCEGLRDSARELIKWGDIGKVALAAALASITLATSFWTSTMGLFGVLAAAAAS